jgi:hypothetical protein
MSLNFQELSVNNKILQDSNYNGCVIINTPNVFENTKMFEKINIRNKSVDLRDNISSGGIENNQISNQFFSKENVELLQNELKQGVYELSKGKYIIPNQNIDQLTVIMRSTYYQYCTFSKDISKEISFLNKIVLDYAVQNVYNSAVSYELYLRDVSTIATPIEKPLPIDRNFKQLELKKWF